MLNKLLLITRPLFEYPTNYLHHWSRSLIELARNKNFEVVDLKKEKATKLQTTGRLRKLNPELVIFNDHGTDYEVLGQDNENIIKFGENEEILSGKIVFTRCCSSANKLGKSCIKKGCTAYLGYDQDFVFVFDLKSVSKPLDDNLVKLFLEPSNQVARALLKGNTTSDSNESSKRKFLKNILSLMSSETSRENSDLIKYLVWDMRHQVCLGDQNAKV